jgi:hypothetical protein
MADLARHLGFYKLQKGQRHWPYKKACRMPSFSLKRAGHVTALPVLPEAEFLVILSACMYLT